MRWKFRSEEVRFRRLHQWHPWFAWFPVEIKKKAGKKTLVWLEKIERLGDYQTGYGGCGWSWSYRAKS